MRKLKLLTLKDDELMNSNIKDELTHGDIIVIVQANDANIEDDRRVMPNQN